MNNYLTSSWIRNNLNFGYIRMFENDPTNLLVYASFDKEIVILDINTNEIL